MDTATSKPKQHRKRKSLKHNTPYTEDEIRFIQKWHGRKTVGRIAKSLKRTLSAVRYKIWELGLETINKRWTPDEERKLRCLWGTMTAEQIAEEIGRPKGAIVLKALRLKLTKERKIAYDDRGRRRSMAKGVSLAWSPQMLADLDRMFANTKNTDLVEYFGISPRTIIRKARERGLTKNPNFMQELRRENRAKARLVNLTRGNDGQFKKGQRANPNGEFGAPTGNKRNWEIKRQQDNEVSTTRIPEEGNLVC